MQRRCYDPLYKDYPNYGARGIKIDPRWTAHIDVERDIGPCPDGYTLERVDNNGPYSPDNCRWATRSEQRINQRRYRQNMSKPANCR